jgi:MazG family protein
VIYHAQMASEQERFDFADVADGIARKMMRRNPHVFGDASREEFLAKDLWQRIKAEEKAERGLVGESSILDDVPVALPALTRAVKLQKRAAAVGFDWPSLVPVLAKAEEEIAELKVAIAESGDKGRTKRVAEEFSDLLFVMANVARHLKVDPEAALREANTKFVRRFRRIEAALAKEGRRPEDATLKELDALWDEAKAAEPKD